MDRVQIDKVKEAIKEMPKNQQENILRMAKTHGVNKNFIRRIKDKNFSKETFIEDPIEKYLKFYDKD